MDTELDLEGWIVVGGQVGLGWEGCGAAGAEVPMVWGVWGWYVCSWPRESLLCCGNACSKPQSLFIHLWAVKFSEP